MKQIYFQSNRDGTRSDEALSLWESEHAVSLPADYRNYIIRYGAKYVYPNAFSQKIPEAVYGESEGYSVLEKIYGWEYVNSNWRKEVYGDGTPEGYLIIGDAQGFQVLLSLRQADFGQVFCWIPTVSAWGSPDNNRNHLYLQADSFGDFLEALFDTEIGLRFFDGESALAKSECLVVKSLGH
ncbi:MAG: SMI1/KNR4 family protein [Neisseria sp.]|nr:SMI1/KNR4 family protein [Neisseria sp.]